MQERRGRLERKRARFIPTKGEEESCGKGPHLVKRNAAGKRKGKEIAIRKGDEKPVRGKTRKKFDSEPSTKRTIIKKVRISFKGWRVPYPWRGSR